MGKKRKQGEKETHVKKRIWKVVMIILSAVAIAFVMILAVLLIPHKRKFSSVHAKHNATYDNIVMFYDGNEKRQYQARHAQHGCFIDSDVELEEVRDDGFVWLKTRAIGIRTYRTDVMGIWVSYPAIVYECMELDQG